MSTYPNAVDRIEFDPSNPHEFLCRFYNSVEALESHVGSAALSGSDLLFGTAHTASSGRTVLLLSTEYTIPAAFNGLQAFSIPWQPLFSAGDVMRMSTQSAGTAAVEADAVAFIENPVFVQAYRFSTHTTPNATLVTGLDGKTNIYLMSLDTDVRFFAGESISLSFLLYGGIK